MAKSEDADIKSRRLNPTLIVLLVVLLFIIADYVTRENGYQNIEFLQYEDSYLFWPLVVIFIYLIFRRNPIIDRIKTNELSEDPNASTESKKLNYILGLLIFLTTYLLQIKYVTYSLSGNFGALRTAFEVHLHYIFNSVVITYFVLIMRSGSVFHLEIN